MKFLKDYFTNNYIYLVWTNGLDRNTIFFKIYLQKKKLHFILLLLLALDIVSIYRINWITNNRATAIYSANLRCLRIVVRVGIASSAIIINIIIVSPASATAPMAAVAASAITTIAPMAHVAPTAVTASASAMSASASASAMSASAWHFFFIIFYIF